MLLRSSSAPVLSALVPEGDNESSYVKKPFAAPAPSYFCNSFSHNRGLSSSRPLRRARSETDLHGIQVSSPPQADEQRRTGEKKKQHVHSFSKLPIIEEKESQLSASVSELDERCVVEEDSVRPYSGEGHRACMRASLSRHLSAPYVHSILQVREGEKLNPLLMANGVGISAKADQALGGLYGCHGGRGSSGGSGGPSSSPHGDSDTTDLYYQKLLQSDPQNPLLLRNYAQYLSEAKHDYIKCEEYYERAILACPNDGEVLSKYAKHVWDVHKDSAKADSYFDQAVKATPEDSYILASYAAFLWQSEEDEEDSVKSTQTAVCPLQETHATPSPLVASV